EVDGTSAGLTQPEVEKTPAAAARDGTDGVPVLEFDHVGFAYRPDEPILSDISLRVMPGETVAVVGSTGAGKSTVIKLLARLYEATGGRILIDGQDTRELPLDQLRRRMVVISQDVFLFSGTIEDNLSLGLPEMSHDRLNEAARRVGA